MKEPNVIYTADRAVWRAWLASHFESESEVLFVFPMKESGEASMTYNDAVEEALCFGWIDSTIRHIDALHRGQRFTPRKKGSPYSRPNIERLLRLDKEGMIHPKIRESVAPILYAPYVFPTDILAVIREDEMAWANYEKLPEAYKRIRIAYIDAARKRPEEFGKRLAAFLAKTREGKLIKGFGGIEKYYGDGVTHEMRLAPAPFAMIESGRKTIELRLYDEKRRHICIGDIIRFTNTANESQRVTAVVRGLHRFSSFEALYQSLPLLKCGYTEETVKTASPADMAVYYSAEEQERYGVLGIEVDAVTECENGEAIKA